MTRICVFTKAHVGWNADHHCIRDALGRPPDDGHTHGTAGGAARFPTFPYPQRHLLVAITRTRDGQSLVFKGSLSQALYAHIAPKTAPTCRVLWGWGLDTLGYPIMCFH